MLEAGVFAFGDGDGFEEGLPELLHFLLLRGKFGAAELFEGTEAERVAVPVGGAVATGVVDEPLLRAQAAAEVAGERLDDIVVGLHPGQPGAVAELLEAQEAFHAVQLAPGLASSGDDRLDVAVSEVAVDPVAVLESERDVAQEARLQLAGFGHREVPERLHRVGRSLPEPREEGFGGGGIGAKKQPLLEQRVLPDGEVRRFGIVAAVENRGDC